MTQLYEKKWKIFGLVAVSIFMSTLDSSIVNVALPHMMQGLSTNIQTIQWTVLIYLATVSSLLLTFGRLSDIKGRKPIYIFGFAVFTLGSFCCGLATCVEVLILSRSLQGVGAAMLMACSPALIVDAFPIEQRGKALGMVGAVVAAGLTCGPVLGGILLDYFSWRYIFYINIPIGLAACMGGTLLLQKKNKTQQTSDPIDMKGSLLLMISLFSLVVFLTQISKWGLISINSFFLSGTGITAGVLFVFNEAVVSYPLFDLKLLRIRLFVLPILSSCILFAGLFFLVFMMPFYLTYPCGFSASKTGFIMIVPFLFLLFVSPLSGIIYDRLGSRMICMAGMISLTLSLFFLTRLSPDMGVVSILWRIGLAGLGTALFISPNNTLIMSSAPLMHRGIASGAVATARNLGMVLGVALAGLVFGFSFSSLANGALLENYTPSMEPFFLKSFHATMQTGVWVGIVGIIVTYARGKEKLNQNHKAQSI